MKRESEHFIKAPCQATQRHASLMPATSARLMHPRDFAVNRTWLAFRVNQIPLSTSDGEFDIFVLQDAGSMFLFGNALACHGAECPSKEAVAVLLKQAWSHQQQWPDELVLPGRPSRGNTFASVAREKDIAVRAVAEARMSFYIKDVQFSLEEYARRDDEIG